MNLRMIIESVMCINFKGVSMFALGTPANSRLQYMALK
jgi:hypothetical protein